MESGNNRIGGMSITPNVPRQTQGDFGSVFARTAQEVVRVGSGVVAALVPGSPVVSAAVASVRSAVSAGISAAVPAPGGAGGAGGTAGVGGTTGRGEQWDLLEAQKLMQADGQKFNMAYLQLQNEMQRESREHNTLSNLMKVRHDSAKAAINNIR